MKSVVPDSILVMCVGNSCRSQMAGAWLRHLSQGKLRVATAGTKPAHALSAKAVQVLREVGLDLEEMGEHPKPLKEFLGKEKFSVAAFVCSEEEAACPSVFPFAMKKESWPFEDPGHFVGTEEEKLQRHREIRDQIKRKMQEWLIEAGVITNVK